MSDIVIAVSENAFQILFEIVRNAVVISPNNPKTGQGSFENLFLKYEVAFHLEGGTVDLTANNTVKVDTLKIVWDVFKIDLRVYVEVCIPPVKICVPVPITPFGPFVDVCIPQVCSPDFPIDLPTIDMSGTSTEISMEATPVVEYRNDPNRLPDMTDLDAEDANPPVPNKWQLFIHPEIEKIDLPFADITQAMLEQLWKEALYLVFPGWDEWFIDALLTTLGPVTDLISKVIAIPMELNEWFAQVINFDLGLFKTVSESIVDEFAKKTPLHELEDPYPIMEAESGLIPVKIPIKDLSVVINTDEMLITADVGQ